MTDSRGISQTFPKLLHSKRGIGTQQENIDFLEHHYPNTTKFRHSR